MPMSNNIELTLLGELYSIMSYNVRESKIIILFVSLRSSTDGTCIFNFKEVRTCCNHAPIAGVTDVLVPQDSLAYMAKRNGEQQQMKYRCLPAT